MNKKGFNLFTALVSFLLITLTALLITSMIQSERRASDTLNNFEARRDIEAIADNAVADAVQSFNYDLRLKFSDYLARGTIEESRNDFVLELKDKTSEQIRDDFVRSRFGGTYVDSSGISRSRSEAFAFDIAQELRKYYANTWYLRTYEIKIENPSCPIENPSCSNDDPIKEAMKKVINNSVDSGNFFKVVECDGLNPFDCRLGTFYVTLEIGSLSPEDYEKLPRLSITSYATKDQVKQIILPKSNFKIYVPLRLFKAIAEARGLAHFADTQQPIDSLISSSDDRGILSTQNNSYGNKVFDSLRLGLCDAGKCAPRQNPCSAPAASSLNSACPGDNTYNNPILVSPIQFNGCDLGSMAGVTSLYDAHFTRHASTNTGPDVLREISKKAICNYAEKSKDSGYFAANSGDDFTPLAGADCDIVETSNAIATTPPDMNSKSIFSGLWGNDVGPGYCTKLTRLEVGVAFEDTNPNYQVQAGIPLVYRITFNDEYSPSIEGKAGDPGWNCESQQIISFPGGPVAYKCVPI